MILIRRLGLTTQLAENLANRTAKLDDIKATPLIAREKWRSAFKDRKAIRECLALMALGVQRCMYCGDNLGTDIDHFEPISDAPLRTFDWLNHILACSFCNSNQKRDAFPRDRSGQSLLIDPTQEDPREHLRLILTTGVYHELTVKGSETIKVFGLNRADLVRGRSYAFHTRRAVLCRADLLLTAGREHEAKQCLEALSEEPHASVLHAIVLASALPGASEVLGRDVLAALHNPRLQGLLSTLVEV